MRLTSLHYSRSCLRHSRWGDASPTVRVRWMHLWNLGTGRKGITAVSMTAHLAVARNGDDGRTAAALSEAIRAARIEADEKEQVESAP